MSRPSNEARNLRIVDRFLEALEARDWKQYFDLLSDDFIYSHPSMPEPSKGREAHRRVLERHVDLFPDFRIRKVRSFASGPFVCAEWTSTTSDKRQGSETQVQFEFCGVFTIRDDKIEELLEYADREGRQVYPIDELAMSSSLHVGSA